MNVKTGDLAILINSWNKINIGKIVIVHEFCGDIFGEVNVWNIEFQEPAKYFNPDTKDSGHDLILSAPDSWLRPVSGIPEAENIHKEKPLEIIKT